MICTIQDPLRNVSCGETEEALCMGSVAELCWV